MVGQTTDQATWGIPNDPPIDTNNVVIDLSAPEFQDLTGTTEFRLYIYGGNNPSNSATLFDKVIVLGTLTDVAAIDQLTSSAIPMNIAVGQIASQVHGTGLRDLNNRLFNLRRRLALGSDLSQSIREGRHREVAASRIFHSERELKIQSTINLNGSTGASNAGGDLSGELLEHESAVVDDRFPIIPSVNVPAVAGRSNAVNGLETFASYDYGYYDLNPLGQNAGIQSRTHTGSVGVEYVVTPELAVGVGLTHVENDNDLSGGVGSVDLEGNAISTYASYFKNNLWGDLLYSQGFYEADINRNTFLGSTVSARPNVVAHQTTLNLGYNLPSNNGFVHGPTFRTDYSWGKLGGYTERGDPRANTIFEQQDYESLITTLGWQINWEQDTQWGTLRPQMRLGYGRENIDRETNVTGTLQNSPVTFIQGGNLIGGGAVSSTLSREDPGEGWMEFGAGVGVDLSETFSITFDYQGRFFQQDAQLHTGTVRGTWKF